MDTAVQTVESNVNAYTLSWLENFLQDILYAASGIDLGGKVEGKIASPKPNLTAISLRFESDEDEGDVVDTFFITHRPKYSYKLDRSGNRVLADMVMMVNSGTGEQFLVNASPNAVLAVLTF